VYFLSIDAGTTSVKVALFNSKGDMISTSLREYVLLTPSENIVELHPDTYWECSKEGIRDVLASTGVPIRSIKSIGICSQGETLIVLDKEGYPLRNAIVWMDNRSQEESEEIREAFGSESRTGQLDVFPSWPITKILWLKKNEPDSYKRIHKYMLVEDYIIYRLTGKFRGEYSLYTSSYMLDIQNKQWWGELLDYAGVSEDQLVELHESGKVIGTITSSAGRELGLDPDTMVVTGAMDQTAAMIGSGNIQAGVVTETTGAALAVCCTVDLFSHNATHSMAVQYHAIPDT